MMQPAGGGWQGGGNVSKFPPCYSPSPVCPSGSKLFLAITSVMLALRLILSSEETKKKVICFLNRDAFINL